jgi:hypothetical protein
MNYISELLFMYKLTVAQTIIVLSGLYAIFYILSNYYKSIRPRPLVSEQQLKNYCINTFTLLNTVVKRGFKIRIIVSNEIHTGRLIGMDLDQFILIASENESMRVAYERIDKVEILNTEVLNTV